MTVILVGVALMSMVVGFVAGEAYGHRKGREHGIRVANIVWKDTRRCADPQAANA